MKLSDDISSTYIYRSEVYRLTKYTKILTRELMAFSKTKVENIDRPLKDQLKSDLGNFILVNKQEVYLHECSCKYIQLYLKMKCIYDFRNWSTFSRPGQIQNIKNQ